MFRNKQKPRFHIYASSCHVFSRAGLLLVSFCIPYHHPTSRRHHQLAEETSFEWRSVLPAAQCGANAREI